MQKKIGVLALQGDFEAHQKMTQSVGADAVQVRKPSELEGLHGLIIPGGESTTLIKLMRAFAMDDAIQAFYDKGGAIFGTCAGSILVAKTIVNSPQFRFGLIDITVERNGYGRQVDSFEKDIKIPVLGEKSVHAVFIRAPRIVAAGPATEILSSVGENILAARSGRVLVCTFHPEITDDARMHRYFVEKVVGTK